MSEVILNSQYNVRVSNNSLEYILINTPYYDESYCLAVNNASVLFNNASSSLTFIPNFNQLSYYYANNLDRMCNYCRSLQLNIFKNSSPIAKNMSSAYFYCFNLRGEPYCGALVTNMSSAYYYCRNLTGAPVCGNNVTNLAATYYGCNNLTGLPVCGPNVTDMYSTYYNCQNLTGSPVCSTQATSLSSCYYNCLNLTGQPVCGPKVTSLASTYSNC